MTPESTTLEDNRSTSEIESEIRKTRGRMDSTLDALGDRFTARSLMNSALDWSESPHEGDQGSNAVRKAAGTIARQARRHPMPSVLIGAGVAWLITEAAADGDEPGRRSKRSGNSNDPSDAENEAGSVGVWEDHPFGEFEDATESAFDRVKEKGHEIGDKIRETTSRVEDRTHHALDPSKGAIRAAGHDLKEGYHTAEKKFAVACDEYPLAVGVGFAALGALVGMIIPRSRREDALMGGQSDQLIDETKEKANELLESGKEVGSNLLEQVKEKAGEQGITASAISDTLSDVVDRDKQPSG